MSEFDNPIEIDDIGDMIKEYKRIGVDSVVRVLKNLKKTPGVHYDICKMEIVTYTKTYFDGWIHELVISIGGDEMRIPFWYPGYLPPHLNDSLRLITSGFKNLMRSKPIVDVDK